MSDLVWLTFISWAALSLQMVFVWLLSVRLKFLSLVDFFWALGIGCGALVLLFSHLHFSLRVIIMVGLLLLWSFRLSMHLGFRLIRHYPKEDPRYVPIKSSWSKFYLFIFFQVQALLQILLLYPLIVGLSVPTPSLRSWEYLALLLSLFALGGEALADEQLRRFKASDKGAGVCDVGLWKFSRHPNYFFEWLFWLGISLSVVLLPNGFWALSVPAIMFFLLNYVTGVEPAETRALQSKGGAYEIYQQRTSRFFPWFQRASMDR